VDLSDQLAVVAVPTLLLWGDADPISPVGLGQRVASRIPTHHLVVVAGGANDLALEQTDLIVPLIDRPLSLPQPLSDP
jgi:poly(3-hydroxyoctanoate) depolymerase